MKSNQVIDQRTTELWNQTAVGSRRKSTRQLKEPMELRNRDAKYQGKQANSQ